MKSRGSFSFLAASLLAAPACAVVATTSTTSPGAPDTTFVSVGMALDSAGNGAGSVVAIGPRTLLTAGHVNPFAVSVGGVTAAVVNSVTYSDWDLRLVNVDADLPAWSALASSAADGAALSMASLGGTGVVRGDGVGYQITSFDGFRHAGQNTLSDHVNVPGYGDSLESFLGQPGDAAVVGGDSGGGFFDSSYKLTGVIYAYSNYTDLTGLLSPGAPTPPPMLPNYGFGSASPGFDYDDPLDNIHVHLAPGTPYFSSLAIDITSPQVQAWIAANSVNPVPEPGALLLLGLGGLALLRRKR